MHLFGIAEVLVPKAPAIDCRGRSDDFAKDDSKVALVAETNLLADARQRLV